MFERIDTVILRVRDVDRAAAWYGERLGLEAVSSDADLRLVVLRVARDHTLTLWQLGAGETPAAAGSAVSYPILAVADAATTRERLVASGVPATPLVEAPGLRYFGFFDPDGNRLEACESR